MLTVSWRQIEPVVLTNDGERREEMGGPRRLRPSHVMFGGI